MNRPRKNSDQKKGREKTSSGRGKHPFKQFIGKEGAKPSREKRRSSGEEERSRPGASERTKSDQKSRESSRDTRNKLFPKRTDRETGRGEEKREFRSSEKSNKSNQESGVAKSGRRFFKKDGEDSKRPSDKGKSSGRSNSREGFKKKNDREDSRENRFNRDEFVSGKGFERRDASEFKKSSFKPGKNTNDSGLIRLNKYLSNAGVASRRDADNLIISGAVKVNGIVVDQLGAKINPSDKVTYGDQAVRGERKMYLLLNKPKDYITTMEDERDRKTVMKLVEGACKERIYPVGRLDRNTTGLLLMTNDGELTTKLTHPKHGVKKVYHVSLNKALKPEHFKEILNGVELEDGLVKVDDLAFVGEGKKEVGVEIHSGKNRVVRRIFEQLGYDVIKLDRVVFAGLTKKDLPRGKYRFLNAKEISFLQMIG